MYKDRIDAGKKLTTALWSFRDQKNTVVVALPRGGIIVGQTIAKTLDLQLELAMVKKIGHPLDPEFSIGEVSMDDFNVDENADVPSKYILDEVNKTQEFLKDRYHMYYEGRQPISLFNKSVILVDDGIASGQTMLSAIKMIRKLNPKRIVMAVPVGPKDTLEKFVQYVEKVICLEMHDPFYAIEQYYQDFDEVSDVEIKQMLEEKMQVHH